MNDFLLEILVEEIPSRFQGNAIKEFADLICARFKEHRIDYDNVQAFVSPRRMVFSAKLSPTIPEFIEEKKGPQTVAPKEVIDKFLKANNLSQDQCIEKTIDKKTFICANIKHERQNTLSFLGDIIKASLAEISWPKSMHWGRHSFHFVRPIRNVMAFFNNRSVDITLDDISLKSRDFTFGHRFLSPQKVKATNIDEYLSTMKRSSVIVSSDDRKKIILNAFKNIEAKYKISVEITESLLNEVIGLVEFPVVLVGQVPELFMKLPEEVIITPMRTHQRYFPTRDKEGKLAPYFVFVANNLTSDNGKTIIKGNERVLNARLSDAYFFFETDLKKPLESHLDDLKKITFQEKLGSLYERTKRLINVCNFVFEDVSEHNSGFSATTGALLRRAATLAKCDLSTTMVCEFTELQGIIGGYYARIQEENPAVCDAIRDQYKNVDDISAPISALLALADKIEIITSFFAIGKEPTGSKDPFALRRAAIGILKIIQKQGLTVNLREIVSKTFNQLNIKDKNANTIDNVMSFIMGRLNVLLKDSGISSEIAKSVVSNEIDVLKAIKKAQILNEVLHSEIGEKLISQFKRAKNITLTSSSTSEIDESLLTEPDEKALFKAIVELEKNVTSLENNLSIDSCDKFRQQLNEFIKIEPCVSNFFTNVLVNTSDEKIKLNRLAILNKLIYIFSVLELESVLCEM